MITNINGIELHYEDSGSGPALIFIHGLGENSASWRFQAEYFERGFRTISLDLRGHGQSGEGEEFITMELFARDILALMNSLDIGTAHFVGLSMGGLVCQELTKLAPHRMCTMTLADAAGFYPPSMAIDGLHTRLERIRTMSMTEIGEQIAKAATAPDINSELLAEIVGIFQGNRPQPYAQATESTLKADYRDIHADINIPTLILVGELDPVTPLSFAQYLNKHIQGSLLTIIPQAAHMTKMENPQAFNLAVARFIAPFAPEAYQALTNG